MRMRVVAAILEDESGRVLLAQRPPGKQDAGLWEFAGGKIESGEAAFDALRRELREELSVDVLEAARVMRVRCARAFGELVLEAWRVRAWRGTPVAQEHSALRWMPPGDALSLPLCEADVPICRALSLPAVYAITPEPEKGGFDAWLATIEAGLKRGLRLVQLRATTLDTVRFRHAAEAVRELTLSHHARLLLNADPELARELGADGVHLSASRLKSIEATAARGDGFLFAASCHSAAELALADRCGVDFAVLSPVRPTTSHPGTAPIGWAGFRALADSCDLPLYALGGITPGDADIAAAHGALGVAGISAFW
jgi:8-oxo-dGTP diphosphatase